MFAIAKFISNLFGWDIGKVQRWVFWIVVGLILILCVSIGLWAKSCWSAHKLKVSNAQLEKINKANEKERKEELQKVVDDNADVIKTVDNRTEIVNTDVYERQRASQERIAEADKQIEAAKAQGRDVTQEELECLLVPDHCQ
jgi:preprotein translocase subunit SecF